MINYPCQKNRKMKYLVSDCLLWAPLADFWCSQCFKVLLQFPWKIAFNLSKFCANGILTSDNYLPGLQETTVPSQDKSSGNSLKKPLHDFNTRTFTLWVCCKDAIKFRTIRIRKPGAVILPCDHSSINSPNEDWPFPEHFRFRVPTSLLYI